MIEALLVDVDGVVVRGRPDDGLPWASALAADLGLDTAVLQREFFQPHWEDVVVGRAALHDRLAPVLRRIAPDMPVDVFVAYWFAKDSRLDRDLLAEIDAWRAEAKPVYLATNQEHARADYLMETLGLADHVDGIFHSAGLGYRKPDAAFFRTIEAALALPPETLLLIDDDARNVEAAEAAGWNATRWTSEETLAQVLARFA